jgi:hypothetical protein
LETAIAAAAPTARPAIKLEAFILNSLGLFSLIIYNLKLAKTQKKELTW